MEKETETPIEEEPEHQHAIDSEQLPTRKKHSKGNNTGDASSAKTIQENDESNNKHNDLKEQIVALWKNTNDSNEETDVEAAFGKTVEILSHEIEGLIRQGLDAFHRADHANNELQVLRDTIQRKDVELQGLRVAEEKNSVALSNVLRALEQSRTQARDSSRAIVAQAGLRAELSAMVSSRDEALGQAEHHKHKAALLQEDLRDQKTKLARVTQEKLKLERDQRATLSLAKSLDSSRNNASTSSDNNADYYKRKNAELNGHIQGLNAVVAEKNRQLDEMRRQIERNMSQNRLANLRREQAGDGHTSKKKKRSL